MITEQQITQAKDMIYPDATPYQRLRASGVTELDIFNNGEELGTREEYVTKANADGIDTKKMADFAGLPEDTDIGGIYDYLNRGEAEFEGDRIPATMDNQFQEDSMIPDDNGGVNSFADVIEEDTDVAVEQSTAIPTTDEQTTVVDDSLKATTFEDTKSWTDEQKIEFNKAAGWGDNDKVISEKGFKQSMAKFDEMQKKAENKRPEVDATPSTETITGWNETKYTRYKADGRKSTEGKAYQKQLKSGIKEFSRDKETQFKAIRDLGVDVSTSIGGTLEDSQVIRLLDVAGTMKAYGFKAKATGFNRDADMVTNQDGFKDTRKALWRSPSAKGQYNNDTYQSYRTIIHDKDSTPEQVAKAKSDAIDYYVTRTEHGKNRASAIDFSLGTHTKRELYDMANALKKQGYLVRVEKDGASFHVEW